ncbi:unnamed protein product [Lampetra planeri]
MGPSRRVMATQALIRRQKPKLKVWLSRNPSFLLDALDSKEIISRDFYHSANDIQNRGERAGYIVDFVIDTGLAHKLLEVLNDVKDEYPQLLTWPPLCFCSPTINRNSVNPWLECNADGRTLTATELHQGYPDHSDRFAEWKVALCSENFSSGRHYWEVCVKQAEIFRVGIAYAIISRRGSQCETWLGQNRASWCLCRRPNGYFVAHDGIETPLNISQLEKDKIGVLVDVDQGLLYFYDGNTESVLYMFRIGHSAGSVHAAFMIGQGSITIVA